MRTRIILAAVSFCFIFASGLNATPGHAACQYRVEDIEAADNMPFINGQPLNGVLCLFYESGKLQAELPHKNSRLDGIVKNYYESGKVKDEISYKNDQREGVSKAYYENGKLKAELPYKNGRPEGLVKLYYDSGKPRFSISYKNGAAVSGMCHRSDGKKTPLTAAEITDWNSGRNVNCQ